MILLEVVPEDGSGFEYLLEGESLVIGRAQGADLVIRERGISRRHARLYLRDGVLLIEDLESRNGVRLNGTYISGSMHVQTGDVIELAGCALRVRRQGQKESSEESEDPGLRHTVLHRAAELLTRHGETTASSEAELRRCAGHLRILNEVHRAVARSISLDDLLELILERAFDHLAPNLAVVYLPDKKGNLRAVATRRGPGAAEGELESRTLFHEVFEKGMAALVFDAQTDDRFVGAESVMAKGVRSLIAAPLLGPDGPLGMILLSSSGGARAFVEEDLELLTSLASIVAISIWNVALTVDAAEHRRLASELAMARRIQNSLLPKKLPSIPGYSITGANRPSLGVSGDFFQVVERAQGAEVVFIVADVSGKGMSASLLTATAEALCAAPIDDGLPPDEIWRRVSDTLEARTPADRFVTAFLGALEIASGRLTYASAGHNPALLVRASGTVELLGRTGLPLGLMSGMQYDSEQRTLDPGDLLVVYTDGVTEAENPPGEEYGIDRLTEVCRKHRSADDLLELIESDLESYVAGESMIDDQTLLVVQRQSTPRVSIPRSLDGLEPLFGFLDQQFEENGIDSGTSYFVSLIAEELFTNLVRHGEGGSDRVDVALVISDEQLELRLTDYDAPPFDPTSIAPVDVQRPMQEREPGGLGLPLIQSIADDVIYSHDGGNLTITVVKKRS